MGKFDRMAKGEKAADRLPSGKKRKFLAVSDKASGSGGEEDCGL